MSNNSKGYTFVELTVVVVLIGMMISLAAPRIRHAVLTDDLKSTTRMITGIIRNLRGEALREQTAFFLHLDLESDQFWVDSEAMTEEGRLMEREKASSFPEGVRVLDVWFRGKGKKDSGETIIRFNKKGYVQLSAIHLGSEDGRAFTLVLSPYLRRVKVLDKYVKFEDT